LLKIIDFDAAIKLPAELIIFLFSALPVVELRGGIPLAIAFYQISPWKAFLLACAGNMLPVIPLLLLLNPISGWLAKKSKIMASFQQWLFDKTRKKHSENMERYGAIGLFLFVATPLPGTGAWTGALLAFLFDIQFRYALPAIIGGVLLAGVIVTAASTGAVVIANVVGGFLFGSIVLLGLGILLVKRVMKRRGYGAK